MTKQPPNRPGPESTRADVRQQLLEAALELLSQEGVDLRFHHISLSQTIEAAGVTRTTAYRSLADDDLNPQEVLHHELQRILMERHHQPETRQLIEAAVTEVMQRDGECLINGDVASRTSLLREVIRVGGNVSYANIVKSTERAVLTSLYGVLRSSTRSDWRVEATMTGEAVLNKAFSDLYRGLGETFSYQSKPGLTFDQLATAAVGLAEGIAMRDGLNPHIEMVQRPTGPDGELREWSLFSTGFEGLAMGMLEPQNPQNPFADLVQY